LHENRRIRLCLKDLYHQDVVEMIERETRRYQVWSIEDPSHPDFPRAYQLLWDCFGPSGEMEREEAIRTFLNDNEFEPVPSGTFMKYFLIIARDEAGNVRGVRDGTILYNPAYAPDLVVVYLAHIFMLPEARGTVLSYWLRIAPVDIAFQYLVDLHARGAIRLPQPDAPGKFFGMRVDLAAEMEYFSPEDRISWQRVLFYGRGGFDAVNPRHFPYRQPDFRDPEVIRATGNQPLPFMVLLRRMGRERQATLPIDEASAVMRLLYDDFAVHCAPEFLENSLALVQRRLEERRATGKQHVELLPLPTGAKDLQRFKRLFRYNVFQRYYPKDAHTREYMEAVRPKLQANPRYLDDALSAIGRELEQNRPRWVYANRDKDFAWDGAPVPPEPEPVPDEPDGDPASN
jgi:hypothetical protein